MHMKSCCKGTCFCVGEHFVSRDAGRVSGSLTSNSNGSGHQGLGSDLGQTWQFHRWCWHQVSGFCVCVDVWVCVCEWVSVQVWMCKCVCVCVGRYGMCVWMCKYVFLTVLPQAVLSAGLHNDSCTHTHVHTQTHTHTHAHTHTHMQAHTHTHTHNATHHTTHTHTQMCMHTHTHRHTHRGITGLHTQACLHGGVGGADRLTVQLRWMQRDR